MTTPFIDFYNTIVRIPIKEYTADVDGFIQDDEKPDYLDVTLFLEPKTSRNPTMPSALDSFEGIQAGVSVYPMKGFFVIPERRPLELEYNKDYYSIYKPEVFNRDSTGELCEIRFILTPLDPVDASFYTGDNIDVIMVKRSTRNEDDKYPVWVSKLK